MSLSGRQLWETSPLSQFQLWTGLGLWWLVTDYSHSLLLASSPLIFIIVWQTMAIWLSVCGACICLSVWLWCLHLYSVCLSGCGSYICPSVCRVVVLASVRLSLAVRFGFLSSSVHLCSNRGSNYVTTSFGLQVFTATVSPTIFTTIALRRDLYTIFRSNIRNGQFWQH